MKKTTWTKLLPVVVCIVLLPSQAVWGQRAPKSAYEKLDQTRLAEALRAFGMNELLEALVKSGKGADLKSASLLVQAKISQATRARDQAARDKLLDEAIARLDKLIKATADAADDKVKLQHYRFRLDRIVVEGITKTAPYIERLSYFQAKPGDAKVVDKLTKSAITRLNRLSADLTMLHDEWAGDEERMVTGVLWKLEGFAKEVRYRGAWIRLYRGMVLPADSEERAMLGQQAIADVAEFAGAADNSSGVKFDSLLLSGMCARLLGEWHNAASFLKRAADKDASTGIRLKAYFEITVCFIDQKKFTEADKSIKDFIKSASALQMKKVAVDLHATLLKNHLLEVQAEAVKKEDPSKSAKLLEESRKVLLDLIEKHPDDREQIIEIIVGKYEGIDTKDLPPDIRVLIGVEEFTKAVRKAEQEKKKTPDFTKAEKIFTEVLDDKRTGDSSRATALWYMGHARNKQRRNDEAARYFRELAEKFPKDGNARNAALNAVTSMSGIIEEKKTTATELGNEFVKEYAHCLAVLVKNWGEKDPKIRSYNYELGMMYDILGRNDEAMAAFNRLDPNSELYLPSRFRILSLRSEMLFDSNQPPVERQRLAIDLIKELRAYSRRARRYAAKAPDKERAGQVLGWGAECGMLIAEVLKDVLNQSDKALVQAEKIPGEWPEVSGIKRRSREFVIHILLEGGQTGDAVKQLLALVEESPKGAEVLIAKAIDQIIVRIHRMEFRRDEESKKKLADLKKAYRVFAEKLYKWAGGKKLPPDRMYGFKQAMAEAYAFSGDLEEVKKSLDMFKRLDKEKSGLAMNVLGLARCYRRLKKNVEAMKQYDRLRSGLPEKSAQWWRAQLERLQFALEIYADNAEGLKSIRLQVRVLRYKDSKMGGFWESFNVMENKARELLKALGRKADTQPSAE